MDIERDKQLDHELPIEEIGECLHAEEEKHEAVVDSGEFEEEGITEVSPSSRLVGHRDSESSPEEEEELSSTKRKIRQLPYDPTHTVKQRTERWGGRFSSWILNYHCFWVQY